MTDTPITQGLAQARIEYTPLEQLLMHDVARLTAERDEAIRVLRDMTPEYRLALNEVRDRTEHEKALEAQLSRFTPEAFFQLLCTTPYSAPTTHNFQIITTNVHQIRAVIEKLLKGDAA